MTFSDKLRETERACQLKRLSEEERHQLMSNLISLEERNRPLKVGSVAPRFELMDPEGGVCSSRDLLSTGPVVVTFYRGLWCPYCQRDLLGFEQSLVEIRSAGAHVVAICHDLGADKGAASMTPKEISFSVLDDTTGDVAVKFGIRWPEDDLNAIRQALYADVGLFREAEPWIVPMQARFVIDRKGIVAFSEIAFNYDQRSEPVAIMPTLRELGGSSNKPE
jgi:peroxiredoxin